MNWEVKYKELVEVIISYAQDMVDNPQDIGSVDEALLTIGLIQEQMDILISDKNLLKKRCDEQKKLLKKLNAFKGNVIKHSPFLEEIIRTYTSKNQSKT